VTDLARQWPEQLASSTELRDRLVAAYRAPDRGYHDVRHLGEVLHNVELLLAEPEADRVDADAVVLAAWFHDAVHDGQRDDEERSAVLAERELRAAGAPEPLVAEVARLVRLTGEHRPEPEDRAGHVLCDADLAILAAPQERYDEYVRDVRREYAHLDDATFREGRTRLLRAFMAEPRLFHTSLGRQRWEDAARVNVERELAGLSGP
jgi:predicted metal-dependent HD superfamily phosphohydrolase